MRSDIIDSIKSIDTLSYKVSQELPFLNAAQPLYLKNLKTIYVDEPKYNIIQLVSVMNGNNLDNELTTIKIILANDAKQQPKDYQLLLSELRNIKDTIIGDYFRRECVIDNQYQNDVSITTLEYRLYKLI